MSLQDWLNNGILVAEETRQNEVHELLKTIRREFKNIKSIQEIGIGQETISQLAIWLPAIHLIEDHARKELGVEVG